MITDPQAANDLTSDSNTDVMHACQELLLLWILSIFFSITAFGVVNSRWATSAPSTVIIFIASLLLFLRNMYFSAKKDHHNYVYMRWKWIIFSFWLDSNVLNFVLKTTLHKFKYITFGLEKLVFSFFTVRSLGPLFSNRLWLLVVDPLSVDPEFPFFLLKFFACKLYQLLFGKRSAFYWAFRLTGCLRAYETRRS